MGVKVAAGNVTVVVGVIVVVPFAPGSGVAVGILQASTRAATRMGKRMFRYFIMPPCYEISSYKALKYPVSARRRKETSSGAGRGFLMQALFPPVKSREPQRQLRLSCEGGEENYKHNFITHTADSAGRMPYALHTIAQRDG
jgi:hypothetical protein